MEGIKTIYEYIYQFLTSYIFPMQTELPYYGEILIVLSMIVTVGIFYVWFIRPFWWLFKYGIWGGSKKHSKYRHKEDD